MVWKSSGTLYLPVVFEKSECGAGVDPIGKTPYGRSGRRFDLRRRSLIAGLIAMATGLVVLAARFRLYGSHAQTLEGQLASSQP